MLFIIGFFLMPFLQNPSVPTVSVKEAYELLRKDTNVVILDVRTLPEWRGELGHVPNALLIPVQELATRLDELTPYRGKTILAICRSGNRSRSATALLNQKGFKAFNVAGGMLDWNSEKLPVIREAR